MFLQKCRSIFRIESKNLMFAHFSDKSTPVNREMSGISISLKGCRFSVAPNCDDPSEQVSQTYRTGNMEYILISFINSAVPT